MLHWDVPMSIPTAISGKEGDDDDFSSPVFSLSDATVYAGSAIFVLFKHKLLRFVHRDVNTTNY